MDLPIVCFDMDGTLLDEQGRIHPSDVALLSAPHPRALFIPSTGRPASSVRCAFARSGLFVDRPIPLNMVLLNGALVMGSREVPLAHAALEPAVQDDLLALAMRFPEVTFLFLSSTEIYVLWPNPFSLQLISSFDFTLRPLSEARDGTAFSKVMCMSASRAALDAVAAAVSSWPVESAFSMPPLLEITNRHVDKSHGIRALLREIGMSGCSFYAAGDGENDLPLFRIAASSFAPASAPDPIRAAASHVIDVGHAGLLAPILDLIG